MNTANTLTAQQRAGMRKALREAGQATRGMDDAALFDAHAWLVRQRAGMPDVTDIPVPKAEPAKPASAPVRGVSPDAGQNVAEAIAQAIQAAMAATAPQIDEGAIIDLIRQHSTVKQEITHIVEVKRVAGNDGDKTTHSIKGAHPALAKALDVFSTRENVFLTGEASSGKTTLAMQAAEALNVPFHFTGAVIDKFELLGFVDAGGTYHRTALREAIEHGGVFLFDEVDSSYPAPLNAFNALLENDRIGFPDGQEFTVDRDKTFFIAAGNTIGTGANRTYVGRFELDRAFLDRFVQLTVSIDETIERAMAKSAWLANGGTEDTLASADSWCSVVQQFRKLLNDRNILALCTTRATRRGAALLAKGWTVADVKEAELYKHLSHDQRQQLGV